MAIKNSQNAVKQRIVKPSLITEYKNSIESMESIVDEILEEEKQEKAITESERQISRAQNILNHAEEIYSRPKKTFIRKKMF